MSDPKPDAAHPNPWAVTARNICFMHLLERLAEPFHAAGIPLMVLKGAALNLTLYRRPDERPMSDLDLLVRPEHARAALELLLHSGCRRGQPLVREDFFPRFYYETELIAGHVLPLKIDLHVRPFRPLRYARLVPDEALWRAAVPVRIGQATVFVPGREDMLMQLAAHAAIHGFARAQWLEEIKRFAGVCAAEIDWSRLVGAAHAWGLALPVRTAIARAEREFGEFCPMEVRQGLANIRVSWRDRLALWHAPRDASHPARHVVVNLLCTPGWRYSLAHLFTVVFPDCGHMWEWYSRRHWGWLPCAHLLRLVWPLLKRIQPLWSWFSKIEARTSPIHGTGVFATRRIRAGELIGCDCGKEGPSERRLRSPPAGPVGRNAAL